jgi:hypothetical protein
MNQGFPLVKLKSSELYGRHHDLVNRYVISVSKMTTDKFLCKMQYMSPGV